MVLYGCGLAAFGLYFLNDWNDWKLGRPLLRFCFPLACILLAGATAAGALRQPAGLSSGARLCAGLGAAVFAVLLIYTLFFALPAKEAYGRTGEERPACTKGVYALCRHPGGLWFAGLYLCLSGVTGLPLGFAVLCSLLNVLLVVFEDICVFPARLAGYAAYRDTTPFLLPTAQSIRACIGNRNRKGGNRDAL